MGKFYGSFKGTLAMFTFRPYALVLISHGKDHFHKIQRATVLYHNQIVALAPGGGGGAGMLKKGKTSLGKTQNIISTPKKKKIVEIKKRDAEAGMEQYAVMLYGDDSYEMENVINVLCKIIPGYGSTKAMKCFEEAQENGKSVIIVTSKPVAEEIAVKIARNKPLIVTDVEGPLGKDED